MALLSPDERMLLEEALQIYVQMAARQMPKEQVEGLAAVAQNILARIDSAGEGSVKGNKPAGISDEWYQKVCLACDKLSPSGCTDKVTAKWPGKCDPILRYERNKSVSGNPQAS